MQKSRVRQAKLHAAITKQDIPAIKARLNKASKADLGTSDANDQTPLVASLYTGNPLVVDELIRVYKEHKLDFNAPDKQGWTPLHHAAKLGDDQVIPRLLAVEGINVRVTNMDNNTPLHYFCEKFSSPNCKEPFSKFLELGADVNAVNRLGETPLYKACFNHSVRLMLIDLLTKSGSDVNICNDHGDSPLHLAVRMGREDLISVLVQAGADLNMTNKNGETPIEVALTMKSGKIVSHLKKIDELFKWLQGLDPEIYRLYRAKFVQANIFLDVAPLLNAKQLESFGIEKFAHRAKILQAKQFLGEINTAQSIVRSRMRANTVEYMQAPVLRKAIGSINLDKWVIDSADLEFTASVGGKTVESQNSSQVYKAIFKKVTEVAVRMPKLTAEDLEQEGFKREFEVMCALQHPNLLKFFGACFEPKLCIVQEYCGLGSLRDVLNNPRHHIGWGKVFKFAVQMTRGIVSLHSFTPPILHRNLHSRNIMITESWDLKISEYALHFSSATADPTESDINKAIYSAPEVLQSPDNFTAKSDVYTIGIVFWEILRRCIDGRYSRPWFNVLDMPPPPAPPPNSFVPAKPSAVVSTPDTAAATTPTPSPTPSSIISADVQKGLRPTLEAATFEAPRNNCVPPTIQQLYCQCVHQAADQRPSSKELLVRLLQQRVFYESSPTQWFAFCEPPPPVSDFNSS
ncbi:ankyrin repeat protein [Pelomyxa schiedti]|nr:ankyrin repeat protein [Pelomyxa schiedti]